MSSRTHTRRQFFKAGGIGALALAGAAARASAAPAAEPDAPGGRRRPLAIGLTTYMVMHYDLDQTIAMAQRVAVRPICIRHNLLPLDATPDVIRATLAKVKEAGLETYGGGVVPMQQEAQVHQAFEYAKTAGFRLLSITIRPDLLPLLERKVKEYDIRACIHNHGPGDKAWPHPLAVYERIKGLDPRIGICHDTGHTMRAGMDPTEALLKTADRHMDVHLKDVDAPTAKGESVELGRGIVDLPRFLRTLVKVGYEAWTLSAVGNWTEYKINTNPNEDSDYTDATDLDQDRTHNLVNEIYNATAGAAITEGQGQTAWADPAHDARGNMVAVPKPSDLTSTYSATYDAWNRLVELKSGANVILKCEYDGLGRRTKKYLNTGEDQTYDEYRHFFYNSGWQLLETRKTTSENDPPDGAKPEVQYVWSVRYIDALVLRDENKDSDDDCTESGTDERLYYLNDANMNVTCLVDAAGDAVERYVYDRPVRTRERALATGKAPGLGRGSTGRSLFLFPTW